MSVTEATPTERSVAQLGEIETAVLWLIAEGHTTAEIAVLVYLTPHGVNQVMRRIYRALGARERAHAVHIAHLSGLLGGPT